MKTRLLVRFGVSAAISLLIFSLLGGWLFSEPVDAGYRDFSFGPDVRSTPTGEKPESKLWFNDGSWWGILYNTSWGAYHIHRLDLTTQTWVDTGIPVDEREASSADALWDGSTGKLYVASHVFNFTGLPRTDPSLWGRLYRYSYDSSSRSYSLDTGFPVFVTRGISETLVVSKDSTNRLWATWVESSKVMVNHTLGSDEQWAIPFQLPVEDANNLSGDDISSLISFQGTRIGVFWSNQNTQKAYFAIHEDSDAPDTWRSRETPVPGPPGPTSDDHISLKSLQVDGSGRVFAVVKTGLTEPNAPLVLVLVRTRGAGWQVHTFARVEDESTRPILLLDEENNKVFVVATSPEGGGKLYYKESDLNSISFDSGKGIPLISSPSDTRVDNPTSTKQNLNNQTGLVVLASDRVSRFYLHGYLSFNSSSAPQVSSFQPSAGEPSTVVTIQGQEFIGATGVYFGGVPADSFSVVSDNQITAVVPWDAQTGKVSVTSAYGTGMSDADFVVLTTPAVSQFTPTYGAPGTIVVISGSGFASATSVTFGGVAGPFSVENDSSIIATVPSGAVTGPIGVHGPSASGYSVDSFIVSAGVTSLELTPVADAMTYQGSPTRNYGDETYLRLREDSSRARHSFLKFNIAGISGPIVSAKLRLYVTDGSPDGGQVFRVSNNYLSSSTPWTEQGISWSNSPAVTGSPLSSAGAVSNSTWVELDVSSAVQSPGIYSFALVSSSGNSVLYSSKEGANSPELILGVASDGGTAPSGPTIQSFLPTSGIPGTEVTVTGNGLIGTESVSFNGTFASFTVDSDSTLRVTVPAGASSGPVSVTTAQGTATSLQNFQVLAALSISSFSPSEGPTGTTVSIYGSGFSGTTSVSFNGAGAAFSVVNSGQIQAIVPASATSGAISITAGTGYAYSFTNFTVTQPAPYIASISPTSGPVGTTVTLNGLNLLAANKVFFGSVEASFSVLGDARIDAVVPSGAVSDYVHVQTPLGTATSSSRFSVTTPNPSIDSISPLSGQVGSLVSIYGSNLHLVTGVSFGGVSSGFTLISPQEISTAVPLGASTGLIGISGPGGMVYSSQTFTVTVPGGGAQTLTFPASADAQVYESYDQSNYGSQEFLRIRDSSGVSRRMHLKFDVSGVASGVASAVLRLYVENGSNDSGTIFLTSNDWAENTITWANAPPASTSALDNPGAIETGAWVEYNVTGAVAGNGVFSFVVISSSGDSAVFTSREGSTNQPELVIRTN